MLHAHPFWRFLFIYCGFLVSEFAFAGKCGEALDTCLVGTWRQVSNDTAEVMNELFPGVGIKRLEAHNVIFKFNPDGTYVTAPATIEGTIISQHQDKLKRMDTMGKFHATGRWSAQANVLTMCSDAESADLTATIDGHSVQVPVGKEVTEQTQRKATELIQRMMKTRPTGEDLEAAAREAQQLNHEALNTPKDSKKIDQRFSYTCEPNTRLETKMTFPGWSKPVTSVFSPTEDVLDPLEKP